MTIRTLDLLAAMYGFLALGMFAAGEVWGLLPLTLAVLFPLLARWAD